MDKNSGTKLLRVRLLPQFIKANGTDTGVKQSGHMESGRKKKGKKGVRAHKFFKQSMMCLKGKRTTDLVILPSSVQYFQ